MFRKHIAVLAKKAYPLSSHEREENGVNAIIRGCNSDYVKQAAVTNLLSGQSLVGLCHGQGSPLLAAPPSHSPLCHNGLAPSRIGHKCLCCSMPRGDPWSGKWEGCQYLRLQLPASKTLSQSRLRHHAVQDPCADNSSVPMRLLLPQQQRW